MGLPTELLVLGHTNIKWMRFAGSTWKTNDKKAFVDKLLINTDPKGEQYETEARQSLFNMVQKDLRSASICLHAVKQDLMLLETPLRFSYSIETALLAVPKHSSLQAAND